MGDDDIKVFYEQVLSLANEKADRMAHMSIGEHYHGELMFGPAIQNMFHLIECRHIMLWVMESVEAMEAASYCGAAISLIVADKTCLDVARLLPVQCSKIKQLASSFENCLSQLMSLDISTALFDTEMTFANEASKGCRGLLRELGLDVPVAHCTQLWRYAVHMLDMAVLSYTGAHTESYGMTRIACINIPGPFLEKQYLTFRRRSFLCLGEFLGGREAWVFEFYHPDAPRVGFPSMYLSTNATTFGDIWGPMWKVCASINGQPDPDHILRYSVGNGKILPWKLHSSNERTLVSRRRNEIFCHWISDRDTDEIGNFEESSGESLQPDDILLIGARVKLKNNLGCHLSVIESKQRLKDSGSLSEFGTMKSKRVVDSETFLLQVTPPYVTAGAQRTYKMRGRTWKESFIEDWKNKPESRNVRILEFNFGVEVSACTYNARRRRLITLLGSNTMINYLRNGSLRWTSDECEEKFYAALKSSDYKAFRKLYKSHAHWRSDLGNAITCCLDTLRETGAHEKGPDLLWVPNSEPGQKVNLRFRKHSWIGFLRDAKDCCTIAILEDNCLQLESQIHSRKCQNKRIGSELSIGSTTDQTLDGTVLETSFMLNQNSIPHTMSRIACRGHNGNKPRYLHFWSTSLLRYGEPFHFGEKGDLRFVESLGNSQIVANWRPSQELFKFLRQRIQGRDPNHQDRNHQENSRDETGGAGPIYVLVMASNATSASRYVWVPESIARARRSAATASDETGRILNLWERGEPLQIDDQQLAGFEATIPNTVPLHTGTNRTNLERSELEHSVGKARDGTEDN